VALVNGARLGPYEILAPLGQGGMGEVYRARDTKLHRDVAIKILPEAFAADADRVARFQREAQVLASLNHPNIGGIYGLEEADGVKALVLELVEGPTLADRLAQGSGLTAQAGLPLDEALPIARQIADALEAAHEHGIIHRDLKPANIKLRPDGTVKVLDFGLAKLAAGEASGAGEAGGLLSQSPTITTPAMTRMGVIMGTAAYMSPEQARGKTVDKRADIWAFGCVLYEMLTGCAAFPGGDVSEVLAGVIKSDVAWDGLPANTPPKLRGLLQRCLQKDPKRRMRDIGDARLEIDEAIAAPATGEGVAPVVLAAPRWRRALPWALTAVAFIAAGTTLLVWAPWRPLPASAPLRVSAELGADASLVSAATSASASNGNAAVVSPDGTQLAFVAQPHGGGAPRLYVRASTS
jgi:serine/threonine protein kinase